MPQPESSASYSTLEIRERVLPLLTNRAMEAGESGTTTGAVSMATRSIVKTTGEEIVVSLVMPDDADDFQRLADEQLEEVFANSDEALACATGNLAKIVINTGLTIERLEVENIDLNVWSVEFRRGLHHSFVASLLLLGDSMKSLESKIEANSGMLACVPARNQLLLCAATDDAAVCEMALLAGFLKEQSLAPLGNLVWILKDGTVHGHKFVELQAEASGPNLIDPGIEPYLRN